MIASHLRLANRAPQAGALRHNDPLTHGRGTRNGVDDDVQALRRAPPASGQAPLMATRLTTTAAQLILQWPRILLGVLVALLFLCGTRLAQIRVDVSARTLVGNTAPELLAWRDTDRVFHLPDSVLVTVAAAGGLQRASNRALIEQLQGEIASLPGVAAVTSVLDAPLVQQVRGPLMQIEKNRRTLRSADVDVATASTELATSPLFRDVLLTSDGRISALRVDLRSPQTQPLVHEGAHAPTIAALRALLNTHRDAALLGLIGTAVVAAEVGDAVRTDLLRLPLGVLVVMVAIIAAGTRRPPILEFACGAYAAATAAGLWQLSHGGFGVAPAAALPVVVVIAVCLAFTLRVSYKLHVALSSVEDPHTVLTSTVEHALSASLPATGVLLLLGITLCLSPLMPVHELGGMVLCGVGCAWLAAFGVGPCLLAVARRRPQALAPVPMAVPARWLSVTLACALAVAAIDGLPRFIQESSIANYLAPTSATRAALALVEEHFGGALSFDVVLELPATAIATAPPTLAADDPYRDDASTSTVDDTWFTSERVKRIAAVHHWLEQQTGVGRVLSLASLLAVGRQLNDDVALSPFELNVMYKRLPRAVRVSLLDPYVQPHHNQARLHVRIHDMPGGATRAQVLAHLETGLQQKFGLTRKDYRVSGPYVVYAHMSDLLAPTLVVTSALAALASLALVILSGRTPRAASRMLTPTLIAALGVMGVAGWHSLRLDLLTVAACAVAFALFVQIRTAGRRHIETLVPNARADSNAPSPPRDPYGSTVIGLGTISVGAGLATMGTAAFAPTAHFGVLCGATVGLALLASQRVSGLRRRFD